MPETPRLTALGLYSDGTTKDLTESVSWSSSDPNVVTVETAAGQRGVLTGHGNGTVTLTAVSSNPTRRASTTVTVVMPAPTVTSITPDSGPAIGGTRVTVKGTRLTVGTGIRINGKFLVDVTHVDDTTVTGTTQGGDVGSHDVEAVHTNGSGRLAGAFRYFDTWQASNAGLYGSSPRVLVRAPDRSSTVYAGTSTGGILKTTDAGLTWASINEGLESIYVYTLAVDAQAPSTLYAATDAGLHKSTDGGARWTRLATPFQFFTVNALAVDPSPTAQALTMDPSNPQVLYAALSPDGAFFKTADGGGSWARVGAGLQDISLKALVVHPTQPNTLYALSQFTLYQSTNGGETWATVATGLPRFTQLEALALDRASPQTLYLATWDGVHKSTNGGASWARAHTGITSSTVLSLLIDSSQPEVLYAGTSNWGVFKTVSGGTLWSAAATGQTNVYIQKLAFAASAPDTAYAATPTGVYKTVDSGATWTRASTGLENRGIAGLAVHAAGAIVYAGTDGAIYKSVNGGAEWTRVFSFTGFVLSLSIHPTTPDTVHAATTAGLYRTVNGGGQWTLLTQGLPANATFYAVAISSQTPSTQYAATWDKVYKTTNGGSQWVEMSTGLPGSSGIRTLLIEPQTADTVYLAAFNEGVFKTVDGGAQWIQVYDGNGLSLAMDPTNPSLLYLGTYREVLATRDAGLIWKPVSLSFKAEVNALALKPGAPQTLLAGTGGRGVLKTTTAGQ